MMLQEEIQSDLEWWLKNIDNPLNKNYAKRIRVVPLAGENGYESLEPIIKKAAEKTGLKFYAEDKGVFNRYDPETCQDNPFALYKEITFSRRGSAKARVLVRNQEEVGHMLLDRKPGKKIMEYLSLLDKSLRDSI